jgi:hypothetical protein
MRCSGPLEIKTTLRILHKQLQIKWTSFMKLLTQDEIETVSVTPTKKTLGTQFHYWISSTEKKLIYRFHQKTENEITAIHCTKSETKVFYTSVLDQYLYTEWEKWTGFKLDHRLIQKALYKTSKREKIGCWTKFFLKQDTEGNKHYGKTW